MPFRYFYLLLFSVSVMGLASSGQVSAQPPRIHLITLSDQGDPTMSAYNNSDVAKMAGVFYGNIPNQLLSVTHLVVPPSQNNNQDIFNPHILEYERLLPSQCPQRCVHAVRYVGDGNVSRSEILHHVIQNPTQNPPFERPFTGNVRNQGEILNAIKQLRTTWQSDDTVVFYYTGHARFNLSPGDQGLIYTFSNGERCSMRIIEGEIRGAILRSRQPDLVVFINDACSTTKKGEQGARRELLAHPYSGGCSSPQRTSASFEALFMKPSGVIRFYASNIDEQAITYRDSEIITKDDPGLYSFRGRRYVSPEEIRGIMDITDLGGIFTDAFIRSIPGPDFGGINMPAVTDWNDIRQRVTERANRKLREIREKYGEEAVRFPFTDARGINSVRVVRDHTPRLDLTGLRGSL